VGRGERGRGGEGMGERDEREGGKEWRGRGRMDGRGVRGGGGKGKQDSMFLLYSEIHENLCMFIYVSLQRPHFMKVVVSITLRLL
jgi:hypothetical protein